MQLDDVTISRAITQRFMEEFQQFSREVFAPVAVCPVGG